MEEIQKILEKAWAKGIKFHNQHSSSMYFDDEAYHQAAATALHQHFSSLLAEKDAEIDRLHMHIQARQSCSDYQLGQESMEANMMQHIRAYQYPGSNSEFEQAMKEKFEELTINPPSQ